MLQSLKIGFRRRWQRGAAAILSVFGAIWLFTEILTRVFPDVNSWLSSHATLYLVVAGLSASIAFVISSYEARAVSFTIPNTGTTLTLKFSNIFNEDADWLVGVNEFFDSTLGTIVSAASLHGQIIASVYNGNEAAFRHDVDSALTSAQSEYVERRVGQCKKYSLGTTAVIQRGSRKIFLVAITKTDTASDRASSSVPILWDALGEAISVIDNVGNGAPLALPLIGNGRASLNIPPQHLLRLITLKLSEESRRFDLPRKIVITLADECFEHLDLREIKRGWSLV